MKTKLTEVKGQVYIWAKPLSQYDYDRAQEEGVNPEPFTYELSTQNYMFGDGNVNVTSEEVMLVLPAGINLIAKAIETLEDAKSKAHTELNDRLRELDAQIEKLQFITFVPQAEEEEE